MTSGSVSLSIIIPAYNEEARLPATLAAVTRFVTRRGIAAEVIVVDDGSVDATAAVAHEAGARVLTVAHRGKAAALRSGVEVAQGDHVLLMDADLATPLEEWIKCEEQFATGADIVIGSRELPDSRRIGEPLHRHMMGRVFNHLVGLLLFRGIGDTQCGFKALRRSVALDLFRSSRLYPPEAAVLTVPAVTAYDVELLYIARRRGYRIEQIPVTWSFGARTTVHPWRDTWRNLGDLLRVRAMARRGLYPGPATEDSHALDDRDRLVVPLENRP